MKKWFRDIRSHLLVLEAAELVSLFVFHITLSRVELLLLQDKSVLGGEDERGREWVGYLPL